jgi:hypothetical protein
MNIYWLWWDTELEASVDNRLKKYASMRGSIKIQILFVLMHLWFHLYNLNESSVSRIFFKGLFYCWPREKQVNKLRAEKEKQYLSNIV